MRFIVLVLGIVLACTGGFFFTVYGRWEAFALVLAGLAVVAGEGFKIALLKETEADKLEAEEDKMEKDLGSDSPLPPN